MLPQVLSTLLYYPSPSQTTVLSVLTQPNYDIISLSSSENVEDSWETDQAGGNKAGGGEIYTAGLRGTDVQLCGEAVAHLFHLLVGFACSNIKPSGRDGL